MGVDKRKCCICGCDLPNRYAVAGECKQEVCSNVFCALHWNRSNHYCKEHGYKELDPKGRCESVGLNQDEKAREKMKDSEKRSDNPRKNKQLMKDVLGKVKKFGLGAGELMSKLKKDKSPEAMRERIEEASEKNQQLRKDASRKTENLHNEIAAKKKEYQNASNARKRVLEAELKARISEYKSSEQRLKTLLENERQLSVVLGRMDEAIAYGMSSIELDTVEDLTDDIEDAVIDFEDRRDAVKDLEKAGRTRERESEHEDFLSELEDFDGEIQIEEEPPEETPETRERLEPRKERREELADEEACRPLGTEE